MTLPRVAFCFFLVSVTSCGPSAPHEPALGHAFVGSSSVNLRKDLGPSATVAVLHFGEKVEIIGQRRIFVRVRTSKGAEGWLNESTLLTQPDMDQIKAQSAAARNYPSQGVSVTDVAMNVHSQPNITAPAFLQLKPGEHFDVLQHRLVTPAPAAARKSVIPPPPKKIKKPKKESRLKIPPPPAPALPLDWEDLSKEGTDANPPKTDNTPPPAPQDWSLVRTSSGQSGWVLTRRLYMAIPDEVAQYAEGHRITSYFPLGKVQDGDKVKTVWLWTTSEPDLPWDFEGVRVFIWSLRHHRYETAFIQRRLEGYFPTIADPSTGAFSICVLHDGVRIRRQYQLNGNRVEFVGEKPCDQSASPTKVAEAPNSQSRHEGALEKLKGELKSIMK